jgi:ATP-binding cassette, subfamily B, bacterial
MTPRTHSDVELFRRLLYQARPYWPHIAGVFALGLVSVVLALLTPVPLKIAIDSVIDSRPLPDFLAALLPAGAVQSKTAMLMLAVALLLVISLLDQLQRLASSLLTTYTAEQLVLGFRAQLFRHVQRLSLAYHETKGSTDSTYRIQYDAPTIQWTLIDGIIPIVTSCLTLAGMIYICARINGQLALVALAISPLLYLVSRSWGPRLRNEWLAFYNQQSSAMSVVQEVLGALRVVKAFGQEEREHERFLHQSRQGILARTRVAFAEARFAFVVGTIIAVGTATVLLIGVRHVRAGTLALGDLLIVMGYLAQLYARLDTLSRTVASLQGSLACAERAFNLLDERPDMVDRDHARPIDRAAGAIALRDVSFGYGPHGRVLEQVSFAVDPGTRVGIVGATGTGKTTLVSLLTRFYDPTSGQVLLDDVDLRDYKLADLRNQFGIVLQDTVLFSASVLENIAYARPGASEAEIVDAAKAANAHDFIVKLPHSYHTAVGERGVRLSGGERQRVSLARAFLKDAPILILDEPTSAVDMDTEAAILQAMERLMRGRTVFIITHRPSMLTHCRVVVTIHEGRLVPAAQHPVVPAGVT